VALSLLLLTGAGLFVRTLYNLKAKDLGFDPQNLMLMTIEPGQAGYKGSALVSLYQEILERLNALPQVQSVSISRFGLIGGGYASRSVSVPGYTPPAGDPGTNGIGPRDQVAVNIVGSKFFQTVGIPMLAGRDLSAADNAGAARVAVVNDKFVRRYYGNENP